MSKTQKKLVVKKRTSNFREAVRIETAPICEPREGEICVRNKYVGINADDANVTKGRGYFKPGTDGLCGAGLDGIGTVVAVGKGVTGVRVGDHVSYFDYRYSAFAEYECVSTKHIYPVPEVKPEYLVLLMSGVTAMLTVNQFKLKKGEKVLITAAAGGLGHIMVQLSKKAGCFVIGTCSSKEKVKFLKGLGCDHIINYKEEDMSAVLSKTYPEGIDVIFETVGGTMFDTCLQHVGFKGRVLVMGGTAGYQTEEQDTFPSTGHKYTVQERIFYKAASVIGGNMDIYEDLFAETYQKLQKSYHQGEIKPIYVTSDGKREFVGMEGIIEAEEYLFKGKHCGKILAKIY